MERAELGARHHRRFGLPGAFHRAIGQRHDRIQLGIDRRDAVEMRLHDLDGRKLPLSDELCDAGGVHSNDVISHIDPTCHLVGWTCPSHLGTSIPTCHLVGTR